MNCKIQKIDRYFCAISSLLYRIVNLLSNRNAFENTEIYWLWGERFGYFFLRCVFSRVFLLFSAGKRLPAFSAAGEKRFAKSGDFSESQPATTRRKPRVY